MNPVQSVFRARSRGCRRAGFSYRALLVVLPMVLALPLIAWALSPRLFWSSEESRPMMHVVQSGRFEHVITERGNVESASNVEIRCEVKSRNSSGTTILWIVEEGKQVEKGEKLVELDSSALERELLQQQIVCNSSKAAVIKAQNSLDTAKIDLEEYVNGKFVVEEKNILSKKLVAEEDRSRAEQYVDYSKNLFNKGFITKIDLAADEFAVKRTKNELEKAEIELKVLQEYTKQKMIMQLESNIKTSEAHLDSEKHSHEIDLERLKEIEEQVEKCVIVAPEPGKVVYASQTGGRGRMEVIIEEGAMIRERQVIIRLPDLKRMQVKAKINEAKVTLVEVNMPVDVRLDAFPEIELSGTVEKVNEYPAPTSWYNANIKEYETIIAVDQSSLAGTSGEETSSEGASAELRPGLTAEVQILVEQLDDVLQVPVQAVIEHGSRYYCLLLDGPTWKAREVTIGSTNDKFVVIRSGLERGEEVVLNAAAHRDKVDLPEPPPEVQKKAQPAGPPAGKKPAGSPRRKRPDPGRMFSEWDKNGDGKLQEDEVPGKMRDYFSMLDADKDGAIDRSEMAAAASRMGRGGGGERPGMQAGPKPTGGKPGMRAKPKPAAKPSAGAKSGADS